MKILVASHNGHKILEIKAILNHLNIEVLSLRDIDFNFEIEENKTTFIENALLKAKTIQSFYPELTILADDSGLCIKALDNQPGIYSARFLGQNTPDAIKNREIIKMLEGVHDRKAHFVCGMVLINKEDQFLTQQYCYGSISLVARGMGSFGYDPIFIPNGHHETFAENLELKQTISHRAKALKEVVSYVEYITQ